MFKVGQKVKILRYPGGTHPETFGQAGLEMNGYGYVLQSGISSCVVGPKVIPMDSYINGRDGWYFRARDLSAAYDYSVEDWNID